MASPTHALKLNLHILKRFFALIPRKSKRIKMLYVEYVSALHEGERIIKYRFTNALYYKVGKTKMINSRITLPCYKPGEHLEITVQGFFRRSTYTLLLKHDHIQVVRIE
jgi:hypothetical protein